VVSERIFDSPDLLDAIFEFIVDECPELAGRADELKAIARRDFSGIETYIPRRSKEERDRVVREVMSAFNGRNATEVGRRLGISRASVYRIIKTSGQAK
jgi:Mor family transcriptional regulator